MKVSIVIPAYNEERLITGCLAAINDAIATNGDRGFEFQVIVVDNNSTDRTAELAEQAGAQVCFEPVNQIARARNAGAAIADGEWLLFIDADSLLSPEILGDIFSVITSGTAIGCGSTMRMEGIPFWARLSLALWSCISISFRWAAGALILCRADAFREIGGFDESFYVAEEIALSRQLKKLARRRGLKFLILSKHPMQTSARKMELYTDWEIARQFLGLCLQPFRAPRDKNKLNFWYDGRR